METFSWSDTVKAAFSSCLPCLRTSSPPPSNDVHIHTNDGTHRIPRARLDELEGLLADVPDTDTDAETHSLHSNLGTPRHGHSRKPKSPKRITFFGWHLFGRSSTQLPADDHDDLGAGMDPYMGNDIRRLPRGSDPRTGTLDADAELLDPSTIDDLSPEQLQQNTLAIRAEEERQKQRRRDRKELKRVARELALGAVEGDKFEGFQGSGGGRGYPGIPGPFQFTSAPAAAEPQSEVFGPFVGAPGQGQPDVDGYADDADFGGELYARRTSSGTASGSDSRSRTSSSPEPSQQPHTHRTSHRTSSYSSPAMAADTPRRTQRKSRSSARGMTTSASQSLSLPSLPDDHNSPAPPHHNDVGHGFPRAGFGGVRGKNGDMGAFLARR